MGNGAKADGGSKSQEELWNAIAAFEQILEIMPQDRSSLETLSHAYEQAGDVTRAIDLMLRLGEVLLSEGDTDAARQLQERLSSYAADDERVKSLGRRVLGMPSDELEVAAVEKAAAVAQVSSSVVQEATRRGFSMPDEIAFAWNLQQAGELSAEEYSQVVQDLTEMSATNASMTVSLLHVLEGRKFKNMPRIMAFVAGQTRTPVLFLSGFEIGKDSLSFLPVAFMIQRGAVVFGQVENDVLAVVMNPYNKTLRDDIATLTGRKAHFFMALPSEFDAAVRRIVEMLEERKQEDTNPAT